MAGGELEHWIGKVAPLSLITAILVRWFAEETLGIPPEQALGAGLLSAIPVIIMGLRTAPTGFKNQAAR